MVCPSCRKTVPDESLFCLACGTRLPRGGEVTSRNGGSGAAAGAAAPAPARAPAAPARAAAEAPARAPGQPGAKQAYALSFRPLPDERTRYRVARWVCEVAPAHQITEVQEGLQRGEFATFLAFTATEAETALERIKVLGVHPAAVRLAPATEAELLLPRPERAAGAAGTIFQRQKRLIVGLVVAIVATFAFAFWIIFGPGPQTPEP